MILNISRSWAVLLSLLLHSIHLVPVGGLGRDQLPLSQESPLNRQNAVSGVISASPLLSFHKSICQIESTTNDEESVGDYLFSYLKKRGFHALRQEVPVPPPSGSGDRKGRKKRFNVFAWPQEPLASTATLDVEGEDDYGDDVLGDFAPQVILTSHMDTVPPFIPYSASAPSSTSPTLQGEQNFNRSDILITGRGTVDAKACVAAQTHAVLSLLSSSRNHHHDHDPEEQAKEDDDHPSSLSPHTGTRNPLPVALLFVVGEEYSGDGMKTFSASPLHQRLAQHNYSTVIFGEPTESRLASGHKGILLFSVRARGRAAHSGYPWLGCSANSIIIPVLAALDELGDLSEDEGGLPRSRKYGKSTVNIGVVQGGVAANVVPESARAEVAVRLAGGTVDDAKRIVLEAVRKAGGPGGGEASSVEVVFSAQGYAPVDLDADVLGFGGNVTVNYGTDIPNLNISGSSGSSRDGAVKRYLFGPGSILVAHGPAEGLRVGELERSVDGYRRLIQAALER